MNSSEIMQFLNTNHYVGRDKRHVVTYLNGNSILGYFNSFSEINLLNNVWNFTMVLNDGKKKMVELNGAEILTIEIK